MQTYDHTCNDFHVNDKINLEKRNMLKSFTIKLASSKWQG